MKLPNCSWKTVEKLAESRYVEFEERNVNIFIRCFASVDSYNRLPIGSKNTQLISRTCVVPI